MFARSGDHARGLGAYANWGAETYLTTYGGQNGTGDYYGFNNISVVSGIAGANGNCMRMRLIPNDGTGKRVAACPYPNISGTPGSSASASALLYGRVEARLMATPVARWKTAWLWWPATWRWTNEIDFPEGALDGTIGGFVHRPNNAGQNAVSYTNGTARYTSWHTTAVEWSPNLIRYILDGVVVLTATNANVASEPLFWQMQTENALSGAQPTAQAFVYVDYVAVWRYVG
jgi:beta-glucanase (GH16 family)